MKKEDDFLKSKLEECKKNNHIFSEWRPVENGYGRHCIYCGSAEVITHQEIAESVDV